MNQSSFYHTKFNIIKNQTCLKYKYEKNLSEKAKN